MSVKKHVFSIGLNDKDTCTQLIDTLDALPIIRDIFLAHKCDCTIQAGLLGIYTMEDGTIVSESSVQAVAYEFGDPVPAEDIAKDICKALNQESVAHEVTMVESQLIYGKGDAEDKKAA